MTINTILFDVGGVLILPLEPTAVQQRRNRLAEQLGYENGRAMWLRFYRGPEWLAAKTGHLTEQAMWDQLLTPHGMRTQASQDAFLQELFRGEGLHPEMEPLLARLQGLYQLGILSNASDRLEGVLEDKLNIAHYFTEIVNSHRIGVAKPAPQAYHIALERLDVEPQEVFFIDNLERNTEAAEKLGIETHLFTDIPSLRADLRARGLLPAEPE